MCPYDGELKLIIWKKQLFSFLPEKCINTANAF